MKTSVLKEADYFIAWAVSFLIATVGGAIIGMVARGILGFLLSLPLSYLAFRFVVAKYIVSKVEAATPELTSIPQSYVPAPAPLGKRQRSCTAVPLERSECGHGSPKP